MAKQNSPGLGTRLELVFDLYGVHVLLQAVADKLDKMDLDGIEAWEKGFLAAINLYAIWNDGVQRIGARETDIKEGKQQLRREISDFMT